MLKIKLKFISWFHAKFPGKYCWADCVAWGYSKRWNPFKIESSKGCEFESISHPNKTCYCGGWQDGNCWEKMSKDEKEKFKQQSASEMTDGIPF